MINVNERNKQIKRAVVKAYPNNKVSVKGDHGTAYGWVNVNLNKKPQHGEKNHINLLQEMKGQTIRN